MVHLWWRNWECLQMNSIWILIIEQLFKKSIFGTQPFWESFEIPRSYWYILLLHNQAQEKEIRCLLVIFIYGNYLKKRRKMGLFNFKELFEFHSVSEIFWCCMTGLRKLHLEVFDNICKTRAILRKNYMG